MTSAENSPAVAATTGEAQGITSPKKNSTVTAALTIITSTKPERLTKRYRLADDGELLKDPGGDMSQGSATVYSVDSLATFARLLLSLKTNQALAYGRPERLNTGLVSKRRWLEAGRPDDPIPRSKEHFSWPAGAGVMMADYDPGDGENTLSRDDLLACLHEAVPALADVGALWWPSSSSYIVNTETGDDLTGLRGQRLYWLALDAAVAA